MRNKQVQALTLSAMFLAIGQVLPFITGQIPTIGAMLSPMHLPVLLCGFIVGPMYGAIVGIICPLLRSVLFQMPRMYPTAIAMAFELCTYGFVSGFMFRYLKQKSIKNIYISLISAMIIGRLIWGIAQYVLLGFSNNTFTFNAFLTGALINAAPAIIIQLILIPLLVKALDRYIVNQ